MKTSFEIRKLYKEDTGEPFLNIEYAMNEIKDDDDWNALIIEAYIEWLESKIILK
jgi:hypothetical protein